MFEEKPKIDEPNESEEKMEPVEKPTEGGAEHEGKEEELAPGA